MSSKKIVLTSSDGASFEIDEAVARKFKTISHMIDDDCANEPIPVTNVTAKILALAIEYTKKHIDDNDSSNEQADEEAKKELVTWDEEFIKNIDQETIFSLIYAANYLNAKDLLHFTCQTAADIIKPKTPEEIREMFGIESDFTPEKEAENRKEFAWAFEELKKK